MIDPGITNTFLSHGVLGACVVVLLVAVVVLWKQNNTRVDERFALEKEYRKDQADQQEKYRIVLEKTNQTLEAVVRSMKGGS